MTTPEPGIVVVAETIVVGWSQGSTTLRKGEVWDAGASLPRERPELFVKPDGTPFSPSSRAPVPPRVQTATRAPGEVRGTVQRRSL